MGEVETRHPQRRWQLDGERAWKTRPVLSETGGTAYPPLALARWRYFALTLLAAAVVPAAGAAMAVAYDLVLGLLPPRTLLQPVWASAIVVSFIAVFALFAIWMERKVSAHMQCRVGPMEVGWWHGWLQTLADGLKLLAKEDLIPYLADKVLFVLAPVIVFTGVLLAFVVVPFDRAVVPADLNVGVFYFAAVMSVEAIGVIMAGWASNNKWALFGTMRLATQLVSYEIPLGLSMLTAVVIAGSLSTVAIADAQAGWFWNWLVFRNPFVLVAFVVFFVATLAENKRAPFDLPEAESELVAGFHTEYSGMRFSIFFLAEYAAMYVVSALGAVLFLGGWHVGVPALDGLHGSVGVAVGSFVLVAKAMALVFVQMWLRWTLPRIRLDQVMHVCLKVLLPFSLAALVGSSVWQLVYPGSRLWVLPLGL